MKRRSRKDRATRLYACFLRLYPRGYRDAFASEMLQTFKDHYVDLVESGVQTEQRFWSGVVVDEVRGILREALAVLREGAAGKSLWVRQAGLCGLLLGLLQIVYNLINNLAPANLTVNSLLNNGLLLALVLCTGCAGYSTARRTNQIKLGVYAGLSTGLLGMVMGASALFIITFACMDTISHNLFLLDDFQRSGMQSIERFIVEDALGATLVSIVISLAAGGLCGTLGGYLGKTVKKRFQ